MKKDAYLVGVPHASVEEVAEQFEIVLPTKETGYIRRLDERDQSHEEYSPGMFGFFTSAGTIKGVAEYEIDMFHKAEKEGFSPFHVH